MPETTKVHIDNDKKDDSMDWLETPIEKQPDKEMPINDKKDEIKATTSINTPIAGCISNKQVQYLWIELKNNNIDEDKFKEFLMKNFKIDSSKNIPKESFQYVLDWIKGGF